MKLYAFDFYAWGEEKHRWTIIAPCLNDQGATELASKMWEDFELLDWLQAIRVRDGQRFIGWANNKEPS